MVPRTASHRLTWPSIRFSQVGELESSKSAMKTSGAGVQRVDDHLAVDGAGDLHAPVLEIRGNFGHAPRRLADFGGFRRELRQLAGIQPLLAGLPRFQQSTPPRLEGGRQLGHKSYGFRRENSFLVRHGRARNPYRIGFTCKHV